MPETPTTTSANNVSDTGQVSYADFAKKIRAKYPQSKLYASKPDKELVDAWIQAKPERAVYKKKLKTDFVPSGPDPTKVQESMKGGVTSTVKNSVDILSKELPAAGGAGFGMAAGSKAWPGGMAMAGLGGMAGAAANEIIQRFMFSRSGTNTPTGSSDDTNLNTIKHFVWEGAKQAGLEGAGRGMGDVFFKILNKIPHAEIKQGIPLLPSDLRGGRVTKYIEDLLTNLFPSSGTMAAFKESQNKAAIGQADKLAKGFSRFRGTSEEFGILIQDTMQKFEVQTRRSLAAQAKTLANPKDIYKTAEWKAYQDVFRNELAKKIVLTKKPELIAGFMRSSAGLEDTRVVLGYLNKETPKVQNAAKTRIMMDVIQEALTGSKDPILKSLQKKDTQFAGEKFKKVLDGIGEEKLKAIYGQTGFDSIQEFSNLIKRVGGGSGNGAGKFLNFIFLLGPLRFGFTLATGKHIAVEGLVFNRAAKIITNPQGVKLYETYIRATTIGGVKTVSAARDALKTYAEHADQEYIEEQKAVEDEYYKEHPDELKYKQKQETK